MEQHRAKKEERMTAFQVLREEHTMISRPDHEPTTDRSVGRLQMAVNRRQLTERLNLDPGLTEKTNSRWESHLKLF